MGISLVTLMHLMSLSFVLALATAGFCDASRRPLKSGFHASRDVRMFAFDSAHHAERPGRRVHDSGYSREPVIRPGQKVDSIHAGDTKQRTSSTQPAGFHGRMAGPSSCPATQNTWMSIPPGPRQRATLVRLRRSRPSEPLRRRGDGPAEIARDTRSSIRNAIGGSKRRDLRGAQMASLGGEGV